MIEKLNEELKIDKVILREGMNNYEHKEDL